MRKLLAIILTLAGILLLITTPSRAASEPIVAAYAPTRFTVQVEGNAKGPAVLLIPGLTSSRGVFDAEAALLAPKYRLYRVQLNGFAGQPAGANSTGPILPAVVDQLHQYIAANRLHPAVIGHSLGGLLGLLLADQHPEDVDRLLIVDSLPFYALVFNPNATVESVTPQGQMMRDAILKQSPEEAAAAAAQTAGYLVKNPDGVRVVTANSAASDRFVMATTMYEDLTTDLRPRLASIKTPTTLLYPFDATAVGTTDTGKIDAVYKSAYSTMPNITLHRIDDSRHFIMFDQPAAFAVAVQAFLQ